MRQVELALKYMVARLKPLELGNEFCYYHHKRNSEGEIEQDSNGQGIVTKYTVKGYLEKVSSYYENFAAMLEELSTSRSAIGVSYMGGKAEYTPVGPGLHPFYKSDGNGNTRQQKYTHHAKYIVTVVVNTEGTQSSMLEGWNGNGIFDTLEHVRNLLDGHIPVYSSTPLVWTSTQKSVQLTDSDKRYGPVLYGLTFEHDIYVDIAQVPLTNVIELAAGQPNITFDAQGITPVTSSTAVDGSEQKTGVR